jgi:hypothetical protein
MFDPCNWVGDYFLFPKPYRLALVPIQPPVQWVTVALSSREGWEEGTAAEAQSSPLTSVSKLRNLELFLHSPPAIMVCTVTAVTFTSYSFHLIYKDICVVIYMSCMARVLIMTICHNLWVCTASCTVGTGSVFTDEEHLEW